MMNSVRYTTPDTTQTFFRMAQRLAASGRTVGSSIRYLRRQANIPAKPPYNPELPPDPDLPIKPDIPDIPDELPHENPPKIDEPAPDVIPVPVREPPRIRGRASVCEAVPSR